MQQTTSIVVNHLSFLGVKTKQLGVLHGRKSKVSILLFNATLRLFSCNHCCSGKAINITYSESMFVTLSILNAMGMRPICRLCPARIYNIFFSYYLINDKIFQNVIEQKMCVWFSLQLLFETFLIPRRMEWDMVKNIYIGLPVTVLLSDFNETWIFWTEFRKIFRYEISLKFFYREPSCSMRTDGLT